jgi:nicotinamidase-related amidase
MSTLIVIDIQKEYITPGRPFYLQGIEPSLAKAKELLEFFRSQPNASIAHVQHFRPEKDADMFNQYEPHYSDFVEGFEPQAQEYYFEKNIYSCYSNPAFLDFIDKRKQESIYLIGYGTTKCVLSTAIDGFHRGHRSLVVVEDATYAKAELDKGLTEIQLHHAMMAIMRSYADVKTAAEVIKAQIASSI